jgi:putative phage-type endonuclease
MAVLVDVVPGSGEWLAARRGGVTATDIVAILGLSSYDSAYSLYWRKTGQVSDTEDNDRFRLGRYLESYIAQRWCDATGLEAARGALYRSVERPWQMATLDAEVGAPDTGTAGVLECKSWADADQISWEAGPPAAVRAQVLWQMDVMDVAAGHVGVVFLPSGEFRSYVIEHENGCTGNGNMVSYPSLACSACDDIVLMRERGAEFMARLRGELPPPPVDGSAASLAALKARFTDVHKDKAAEVDATLYAAWSDAKDVVAFWEKKARGYEAELREQAGECGRVEVGGQLVAHHLVFDANVKAHVRHMDMLRRAKQKADENAD